ncbi:BQ5605_C009g05824 [Microbotryum silenes-dioicae]|uniref:BQ5605_C009g05824 protein n=1 Tax=Microbotryum silenes-dioicae TaxID=796604 RepID=A0A2X0MEJ8_9BASI|nr:BQ5605_C009g05824 [Microbotryum silenes-dioicae]
MSDSDVPKPTTLTVPPPRPPTQITAFAASDLLRDADGYQDWVLTLCSRMPSDVIDYLKSGVPPTSWPPAYVPLWDHYARASICAAVDPRLVLPGLSQYFGDTHSGHKIWAALRTRYGAVSAVDLLPVISRLFSPDLMPDTADAFLQFRDRFENDSRLLNDSDVTTDSLLASHLLARMPPSLSAWRTTFVNSQGTSRTLPHAAEILDRIYREIKARPIDPLAAATVTATSPQRTPPSPCPNPTCRKMHWLRDCPDTTWAAAFRARKAASGTTSRAHKKGSRTIASPAVTSPTDTERPEPTTFTACLLATPSAFPKSAWLLDSGANRHMANDSTLFSSLRPFTGPHVAGVAGSLPSTGCGSVRLSTSAGPVVATDVLLVPSLPCNLLSVRRLDRLGFTVSFGSGHAAIRNSSGTVVATARAIANDLYALNVAPSTCMPNALLATPHRVSLLTLHRRLAHLPVAQLKNVVQKGLVTGVDWVYSEEEFRSFHCNACLASKAHALPFARSKSIAPGRLALIHVDVAQMPRASFGGHRYMLVIVDDYSRKQWCLLLTYKSDVFHRLRDWILEVENATGDRVKTIRSDNGGEFTLRTFVDFCVAKGIRRELTIPYTPQQNGRVERTNRTIKEGILALLYSAGADTRLWAEAAKYFVHCKNLLPHAGIHGEVPDTRWYGMAPDVSSLRTFGCRAWHCLPSVKRTDLDPKAVPLIFVGLDDHAKAYRLFDPATRKILLSRNVVFRESEFPALQPAANTTTGATPLPVAAEVYPDQVDHSEPLLVASPRSPAPRAAPPAAPPGPAPVASDQGPSPASDQGSPTASDQGSSDSAISTPCPSPRPVVPRPLPAPPSPARSESPDPIDLLPRSSDLASFCLAPEFPDDLDDALHSPPPVAYLASGAAALLNNAPPDSTELIAPARDPPHWRAAMATPQADEWRLAAQAEFDSLSRDFSAFTPIDESLVPADAKILGSRFVFRTKRDQHGQVKSYKGRLVARGDSQRSGIDFDETFAPVAKFTSIRALLALAAAHGYHVHQADIDKAYLHGKLDKPLYIRVPDGIYMPGKVLQLHRSLYGLRQAGRIWNDEIDSALSALGYAATESDHCVYVRTAGDERHYIALYVDDLLMISPSLPEIERTLQGLEQRYGVKRLGEAEYILGIQIRRSDDGSITLSQEQYLKDVLARFGMSDAHPVATPMQPDLRLEVELQPTPFPDRTRYLQAIGSLMYASTGTRPDLAYTVGYLARFSRAPSTAAWGAIKHAFRYVAGTLSHGLRFAHGASPPLVGYSDCNWGACLSSSKSTMGYNFIYAGAAVSWSSRLQSRVADSTCDAEYLGLSHAGKEAIFLRQLFGELGLSSSEPVLIYGDNQGANALTKNPVFHARTRHIRLREHFVRDMVSLGDIVIQYITTSEMTADIFTKALSRDLFARHRGRLGAGQLAPRFSLSCSSNFIGLVSLVCAKQLHWSGLLGPLIRDSPPLEQVRNVVFRESEFPALRPATDVRAEPIPLPVTVDAYPDQVDPLEPSLVASPRSLAPRAEPPRPVPAAPDQGPHRPAPAREVPDQDSLAPPAPDQGSPARELPDPESPASSASDQGSSDSAISTPCPSPRPVASRALPAPPSPARSDSPDPIDLLPRPRDVASLCQAQGFPDDVDDALHSPSAVAYLASGAAALIETSPVDPAELIAPARDPPHWRAAMATPQADEWRLAARDEFDSLLRDFSAFTPIDESLVPADAKVLGSRFVFRTKRDQHGQVKSYKGRLVARGDSQRSGIDFDETFAPVAKFTSIRALLALAAAHGYHVHQADIDKAYLHGKLDAPLYICVPDGIYMPGKVLQLHRSLYGLRQAGRIWNDEIDSALSALGYVATGSDHCVYVRTTGDVHHYIALYVDDLLMISPSLPEIERTLQGLEQRYGVKRLGEAEYVLGIQIRRSPDGSISLSQEQYLKDVLARFGMSDAHPVATPMPPDLRLEVELQPTPFPDRTRYLQAIGSLMYASTGTRPDLAYTVGYLARFSHSPSAAAWGAVKHAFR